jgi:copper(I)-binding protein
MKRCMTLLGWVLIAGLTACGAPASETPRGPAATSGTPTIMVADAWVRPVMLAATPATAEAGGHEQHGELAATDMAMTMTDMNPAPGDSAAYMTITNAGTADTLVRVSTDVAEAVELHNTTIDNNVARMRQVQEITIPANGQVKFQPGSYHAMLINVKRDLKPGDTVTLTLQFKNAGEQQVTAQVREQ